jgi:2'-5' RNA ligase
VELEALHKALAGLKSLEFASFPAGSFYLYRCTLRPTGSVYTKLAEFPLTKS